MPTSVIALQRELARAIVSEIQIAVSPDERARLESKRAADKRAYELWLRGRAQQNQWTEEGLTASVATLRLAIERDPGWAPAHAALAQSLLLIGTFGVRAPRDIADDCKTAALAALQLDATLAEAHTSLAFAEAAFEWKWADAEHRLRHALSLKPGDVVTRHYLGILLMAMGRWADAIAELARARDLDPLSPHVNSTLGWCYAWAGQPLDAIEQLQETLRIEPHLPAAHFWLGDAYRLSSKHEAALAEYEEAARLFGGPEMVAGLGHQHAVNGHLSKAHAVLENLQWQSSSRYVTAYAISLIHVALGEIAQAFTALERAAAERTWWMMFVNVDPRLGALRGDSRFAQLVARVGLPPAGPGRI